MAEKTNSNRSLFDAYELAGIICPGTIVALLLTLEWPPFRMLLGDKGLNIGDLGLFALVAFVLGHLIQAAGNLIELIVWLPSGIPTNWVKEANQRILTSAQRTALKSAIGEMEKQEIDFAKFNDQQWLSITTRIYGRLKTLNRCDRVDIASRAYGLNRGLAGALLVWLIWYLLSHLHDYTALGIIGIAFCASVFRMRRAGIQYARTIFIDFIDLPHQQA